MGALAELVAREEEFKRLPRRTALISVTAKAKPDIADFVRQLLNIGPWRIISSGGTCEYLRKAGLEVEDVADVIAASLVQQFANVGLGFVLIDGTEPQWSLSADKAAGLISPKLRAMLGHRVVTLAREKSAMLLAKITAGDTAELETLGLSSIDLVACDFYALKRAIEAAGATTESVVEATDIGGPTMVSEGAKGRRIVICDPADRQLVLDNMRTNGGDITPELRNELCAKADGVVADYRLESARFHSQGKIDGVVGSVLFQLEKGESGAQSPAYLHSNPNITYPLAWRYFKILSGLPGYVNLADMDRVLQIMCRSAEAFRRNFAGNCPYIAVACKHGNACGLGVDLNDPSAAVIKAMLGDPIAVMGAEFMTNFPVTDEVSQAIYEVPEGFRERVGRNNWGVDVVCAPEFSDKAIEQLGKRAKRKLLANPALTDPVMNNQARMLRVLATGEFLTQGSPSYILAADGIQEVVGGNLTHTDLRDMIIAWVCAWQADSNTAALAKDGQLIGLGCGDQDRIWCCDEAIRKAQRAGHSIDGAKFASDGFFPYAKRENDSRPEEGLELFINAGCSGGVVPADGQNLQAVKDYVRQSGIKVAFVPAEHRGFMFHA